MTSKPILTTINLIYQPSFISHRSIYKKNIKMCSEINDDGFLQCYLDVQKSLNVIFPYCFFNTFNPIYFRILLKYMWKRTYLGLLPYKSLLLVSIINQQLPPPSPSVVDLSQRLFLQPTLLVHFLASKKNWVTFY